MKQKRLPGITILCFCRMTQAWRGGLYAHSSVACLYSADLMKYAVVASVYQSRLYYIRLCT
ncbi:MAG: hypothetical protein LBH90_10285, partial [Tannerella sp.]|nr:hypothetical protein [Tannerella sp.]